MLRKINFLAVISVIVLSITVLAFTVTSMYKSKINEFSDVSNSFYNDGSVYFYQNSPEIDYYELNNKLIDGMLLYNQLSEQDDIRGVIFKGKIKIPKLEQGRFFDEKDFASDSTQLAVVGKNIPLVELNGQKYYNYYGADYKVIGVIGYDMETKLDEAVFLSMNQSLLRTNVQYIVHSKNLDNSYNFAYDKELFGEAITYERKNTGILNVIDAGKNTDITMYLVVFVLFLNTFILIYFYIDKFYDEVLIMKINGLKNKQIFGYLVKKMSVISVFAVFIGIFLSMIFSIYEKYFSLKITIISAIEMIVFFEIIIIVVVRKLLFGIKSIRSGEIR